MKNLTILFAIGIFILSSSTGFAAKIYKWTDSEGNTHYGERPPSNHAKQIKVRKGPTGVPKVSASSRQKSTQKLLDAFDDERKHKEEAATKSAEDKARRDKNCSGAKRNIASLNFGGRQYEVDEQGERRYLTDSDIKTRTAEAQKAIDKWCK